MTEPGTPGRGVGSTEESQEPKGEDPPGEPGGKKAQGMWPGEKVRPQADQSPWGDMTLKWTRETIASTDQRRTVLAGPETEQPGVPPTRRQRKSPGRQWVTESQPG